MVFEKSKVIPHSVTLKTKVNKQTLQPLTAATITWISFDIFVV